MKYSSESLKHAFTVFLSHEGTIIDIETNIQMFAFTKKNAIGKNWFEFFLDDADQVKVKKVFYDMINHNNEGFFSCDIKSHHGKHEYIDFKYEIFQKNDETIVKLFGNPHYWVKTSAI